MLRVLEFADARWRFDTLCYLNSLSRSNMFLSLIALIVEGDPAS